MNKMFRALIVVVLAMICVAPLHAQAPGRAAGDTNSSSTNSAPDDVMKKLSELVRAGRYEEAHQLTAALLLAFPDDQRLIKAKALLGQALLTGANRVVPPPPVAGSASVVAARAGTEYS